MGLLFGSAGAHTYLTSGQVAPWPHPRGKPENLPPISDALSFHVKRFHYQVLIYGYLFVYFLEDGGTKQTLFVSTFKQ